MAGPHNKNIRINMSEGTSIRFKVHCQPLGQDGPAVEPRPYGPPRSGTSKAPTGTASVRTATADLALTGNQSRNSNAGEKKD